MPDSFAARFSLLRSRRDETLQWLADRLARHWKCTHRRRIPVRYRQTDQRLIAREQCVDCGHLGRALPLRALPPLEALPMFDAHARDAGARKRERYERIRRALEARYYNRRRELYGEYLESPQWKALAVKVRQRADGVCEGCHRRRPTEVHHSTYSHIGEELLFQLVALCRECHGRLHGKVA